MYVLYIVTILVAFLLLVWVFTYPSLIRRQSATKPKQNSGKGDFSIEHYPETNKYYPKCGNFYMKKDYWTGIVELNEPRFFMYSDGFSHQFQAENLIKLYKEQSLKENVHTIKVD